MTSRTNTPFGRNVFVLDISGSMDGMKCQTLQLSVTRIIEDIPDKSFVGIVLFDDRTELAHKMVQITNRSIRDQLIRSVPAKARGGTRIGHGLLTGVKTIRDAGIDTVGANLFLVTDGKDHSSYVDNVLPTLLKAKIKVICIAIGRKADPNLERLSNETHGKTYSASDSNKELTARVIEAAIQEVNIGKELTESANIYICDDILLLDEPIFIKNVTIDPDIGSNTVFTIGSEDIQGIRVFIQSPNGHKYDENSPEMTTDLRIKRIQLRPFIAEPGVWSINLAKRWENSIAVNLSVKSQPLNERAINLKVTLKEPNSGEPPIIIAELNSGSEAIVGAEVTATVDRPDETQTKIKLKNFNNIYCNYFTDYCGSGRYNVTVLAHNLTNNCRLMSMGTGHNSEVYKFERQRIASSFKVTDSFPQRPSNDNKLEQLSLSTSFNKLSMQSPGYTSTYSPKAKTVPKVDDIKETKENIYTKLLFLKKSINSPKISESERNIMRAKIDEIYSRLSSSGNTLTLKDLNDFLKQLETFEQTFN